MSSIRFWRNRAMMRYCSLNMKKYGYFDIKFGSYRYSSISRSTAKSSKCVRSKKCSARELPVMWSKFPYITNRIAPQNKWAFLFSLGLLALKHSFPSTLRDTSTWQAEPLRPISLPERVTGNPVWHNSVKAAIMLGGVTAKALRFRREVFKCSTVWSPSHRSTHRSFSL